MNNWSERMRDVLNRIIGNSESQFGDLARIVADEIATREPRPGEIRPEVNSRGGGLSVEDIERIVDSHFPNPINLYPGKPGAGCHEVALFFALHGKAAYGPRHYTFEEILQTFIQHMDRCPKTRKSAIITDSWWAPNYERWQKTIERIQREKSLHLEIYMVGSGWQTPIPF